MKILYVTNMYPTPDHIYNGIHVKEQIDHFVQKYPVDHELVFINGRKSRVNYIKSIFSVNKLIARNKYDIVHIHFGLSGFFLLFNPFVKTPVVVTLHGSDTNASKNYGLMLKITTLVARRATRIIIQNDKMISILRSQAKKLVKIPCGINVNTFNVLRKNNGDIFCIGFPGDATRPGKNFTLFKQVVDILSARGHKIKIIEFHNLTREQVVENLSMLDCLFMTSLYEGSPQIIKEAMAAGVPVISTQVGDVNTTLTGVSNCFVIDSFEAINFIPAFTYLLSLDYRKRITNGKDRIEALQLDQDSVVSKIFDIYRQIPIDEKES